MLVLSTLVPRHCRNKQAYITYYVLGTVLILYLCSVIRSNPIRQIQLLCPLHRQEIQLQMYKEIKKLAWGRVVELELNLDSSWRDILLYQQFKYTGNGNNWYLRSSPTFTMVFFSAVCYSQPPSENIKWKIPEMNNSYVLNCMPFWVAWWNLTPSRSDPPRILIIPLSHQLVI